MGSCRLLECSKHFRSMKNFSPQSTPVISDTLGTAIWCPYERESVIAGCGKKNRKCICWIYSRRKYLDRLDELSLFQATRQRSWHTKQKTQPERQKRWQVTEVDYDCFASVKKFGLLSVMHQSIPAAPIPPPG